MKTFRQALIQCTPQQLEEIFHLWGMSGLIVKGPQTRQDVLLRRVQDPIAARFVWEYLSPDERQVLYRILGQSARSGTRRDVILKKSQLSETSFAAVITSLKQRLLLWENTVKMRSERPYTKGKGVVTLEDVALLYPYMESVDALYTAGKEYFSPKSDRSTMTLDKILSSFYHGELDIVANRYSIGPGSYYTHAELRSMIEDELVQPNGAFEVLQHLDPPNRDLLKWLCEQGNKVSMLAVRKHTGYDDTTLLTALHQLEEYALAFDTFSEQERVLFVPSNTYQSLKKATMQTEPEVIPAGLVSLASPPPGIRASHTPIVYDLAVIIGAIYQQNIEPTQAGKVPKRLAAKIDPMLRGQPRFRFMDEEDTYMEMLFHIAQELGILRLSQPSLEGIKARYEPGLQLEQWSQLDLTEQARRLLQCWTRSFSWLDIRGVNFRQHDPFYWNPMAARGSILEQLQKCTPGQWYSVSSLLQTIWDKDPFELRPVQYNIRPIDRRKTSATRARWSSCEGEVYIGLLASTLYELGIVGLGYEQADLAETDKFANPDAFMLTDLGAAVLASSANTRVAASPLSNGNRSLVLQPNFELLLLRPDIPTLYSLLPFAQVNQVDMVSRLTLTRASVLRGIEAGNDIEQILRILEERSQKEIPQNVAYTLRDWVKLYKDVKIAQVLLLEVSSEAAADEICSSPKLQAFNPHRLGPRVLVVSSDINLQELRRILEKEGIIVRVSGDILTRQNRYALSFGRSR